MKLNNVDFNKIAVFCQVVESGNYQRASETLLVTPSAISQSISALENALGFSLFDRRGRRLIPTKEGLRVHQEFRERQTGFFRALSEMRRSTAEVSGTLRIGAYLEFAKSHLPELVGRFLRDYPAANIKMTFDSPSRLHRLVADGQLDLCISIFPAAKVKAIRSRVLCDEELVLIAAPHLLPESPSFDQMMNSPMVDYYLNHQPIRRWIALHYEKRPKRIPVRVFAATAEMVVALVRSGAGVGVVPRYLVEGSKDLRVIRPTQRKLTDHIWLLEPARQAESPARALFRERLLTSIR